MVNITKSAKKPILMQWLFWHRWLGLLSCIGVLLWGLSGLSHPIMTRLQPKPVAFAAPAATFDLSTAQTPQALLTKHGIKQFQHLSVVQLAGQSYLRVGQQATQAALYLNLQSGALLPNADQQYAQFLASHFTGLPQDDITDVRLITAFDEDYHPINRLLPVWRVTFKSHGHLRAYIDTEQTRLSTLVDDTRYRLTQFFMFGHNWSFLASQPFLQFWLSATMLGLILFSAISGLTLYIKQASTAKARLARWASRRWHRRLGLLVSLTTLIFASSGFFHLTMSDQQQQQALQIAPSFADATSLNDQVWRELVKQPLAKLDAVVQTGTPFWYVLPAIPNQNQMPEAQVAVLDKEKALAKETLHAEHAHVKPQPFHAPIMFNATQHHQVQGTIEDFARRQVAGLVHQAVSDVHETTWVTAFAKEYGFVFKRLPVLKVQLHDADNTRFYIEPSTGALAVKVRDIDGLEGFVFAYLHKWAFQSLNKELRDVLVSLFALITVMVGVLGIVLFATPRKV